MLNVTLLGCGGSMPLPNRYLSATLLQFEGRKILIDCGEGTQVSMKEINTGFKSLDLICLTHLHGDHLNGLPGLLATMGNSGRIEPVIIIGPIGVAKIMEAIQILVPYLPYELQIIENPQTYECLNGQIKLTTLELDHSAPCLGYTLEVKRRPKFDLENAIANQVPKQLWNTLQKQEIEIDGYTPEMVLGETRQGIKMSLITDTRPTDEIIPFIKGSDLFICEGTYGDNEDKNKAIAYKHMTFSEAATLAKEGQVKQLLLTHLGVAMIEPEKFLENATHIFQQTIIGYDHYQLSLNFRK